MTKRTVSKFIHTKKRGSNLLLQTFLSRRIQPNAPGYLSISHFCWLGLFYYKAFCYYSYPYVGISINIIYRLGLGGTSIFCTRNARTATLSDYGSCAWNDKLRIARLPLQSTLFWCSFEGTVATSLLTEHPPSSSGPTYLTR